jgi:hypothetical protein
MALRKIVTYKDAFELIGVKQGDKINSLIKSMESEGHTEKSISFSIWRSREKLRAFKNDSRFLTILKNEIRKWSWPKNDPRWIEYWDRKNEEKKAELIRKEIEEQEICNCDNLTRKKFKGFIYFFQGQSGGAIKIGYSSSPEKRLKELQTGYPDALKILLMIPGDEKTERIIHRQLKEFRLKGEWFKPDRYVVDKIKELKARYGKGEAI